MTLQREGSKVWIEGVPTLQWGADRECTFAGALELALGVTDHPYSYWDIMGYTALAFRVRWYKGRTGQRWCPSSPCGEFPDEIAAVQTATGWRLRIEERLDRKEPKMDDFTPDIIASIDSGLPVLGYEPGLNAGVIYGYEDQGKTLLMRDYMTRDSDTLRIEPAKLGGMLMLLGNRTDPLPQREAVIAGLKMAVRNARRDPVPAPRGEYHYGEAALSEWIGDLGEVAGHSKEERSNLFFVSWWNFDSLCDARYAAVAFLKGAADVLGGDAGKALERAAALYQKENDLLGPAMCSKEVFLGPWTGRSEADWTDEVRAREREILTETKKIESNAVAQIQEALAALDA